MVQTLRISTPLAQKYRVSSKLTIIISNIRTLKWPYASMIFNEVNYYMYESIQ